LSASFEWQIRRESVLTSTQERLKEQAEQLPEGSVLLAQQQTQGHGRESRVWHSDSGGLYVSWLLKPDLILADLPLTLLFAVCETLENLSGLKLSLKWPNDILANGAKLAGMLIDSQVQASQPLYCICGVGINLNQTDFSPALSATSLALLTQQKWSTEAVLNMLLINFKKAYLQLLADPEYWRNPENPLRRRSIEIGYNRQEKKTLGELLSYE
jgi:BirA family transcriptional regulator, biotin operon repressor / biotin---[acetyl-CoA-carboxylase] ligase